jgi:hypothetical protein
VGNIAIAKRSEGIAPQESLDRNRYKYLHFDDFTNGELFCQKINCHPAIPNFMNSIAILVSLGMQDKNFIPYLYKRLG